MSATMDKKWVIDKLNGTTWTAWKFQMKHLLFAKDLWGVVDGTDDPGEGATPAARAEFQRKSQKTFSVIALAISTSRWCLVTSYVSNCKKLGKLIATISSTIR